MRRIRLPRLRPRDRTRRIAAVPRHSPHARDPFVTVARWLTVGVALALALACGDDGTAPEDPPVATTVRLTGLERPIFEGDSARLGATVRDQRGAVMAGTPVTWTSRDSTTAVVDTAGVVRGVATGEAWIVAAAGLLADSVAADVRFDVAPGAARVRLTGAGAPAAQTLAGVSIRVDFLGRDEPDYHVVVADGEVVGSSDFIGLLLAGPSLLPEGRQPLTVHGVELLQSRLDGLPFPVAVVSL